MCVCVGGGGGGGGGVADDQMEKHCTLHVLKLLLIHINFTAPKQFKQLFQCCEKDNTDSLTLLPFLPQPFEFEGQSSHVPLCF